MTEERLVTAVEAISLILSGEHDDLTVREFRERFPIRAGEASDPRGMTAETRPGDEPGDVEYVGLDNAVLLDTVEMSLVTPYRKGVADQAAAVAVKLGGRLNRSEDRASLLVLTNGDGLAGLVVEALSLAERVGEDYRSAVWRRVVELNKKAILREGEELGMLPSGTAT